MNNVLDLRKAKVEMTSDRGDFNWIAAAFLSMMLLLLGVIYFHWLDSGCALQGIITAHGRVCMN